MNDVIFNLDILRKFSFKTSLDKSLRNPLNAFNKDELMADINNVRTKHNVMLGYIELPCDYRVKSMESIQIKYDRYFPHYSVNRVYNDILGLRMICESYDEVMDDKFISNFHNVSDMRNGKQIDDGYRGLHAYFYESNFHYPIELQFNTLYDRMFNDWLHIYLYKRKIPSMVGATLKKLYDAGKIANESDFRREKYELFGS